MRYLEVFVTNNELKLTKKISQYNKLVNQSHTKKGKVQFSGAYPHILSYLILQIMFVWIFIDRANKSTVRKVTTPQM